MILFVDSSSVVSLHLQEPGRADTVGRLIDAAGAISCSLISYVEVRRALARAGQVRPRRLTAAQYARALAEFNSDWPRYLRVAVNERLAHSAAALAEKHLIKSLDALQLASALTLRDRVADSLLFSSWDNQLNNAASAEGLEIA